MNPFELFEQKLADKLNVMSNETTTDGAADPSRFDPTIILTILSIIIPMIQDCFNPPAKRLRQRHLQRPRLMAEIRKGDRNLSWAEVRKLADACFDVAEESSDEECKAFVAACMD